MDKATHSVPLFRADSAKGRFSRSWNAAKPKGKCAHHVFTSLKFPLFTRDSGVLVDSQSVGMEVI